MPSKRKTFIDIAKGIGIFLVIIGHLDTDGQISREIIYSFHMPLFFILSGALGKKCSTSFTEHFKKSFKSLYVPYFVFIIIDILIALITYFINGNDFLPVFKSDILALTGFGFEAVNRPIWFLFALFVIRILYFFISKSKILMLGISALGISFVFLADKINPMDKCLYIIAIPGLVFYIIGAFLSKYILNIDTAFEKNLDKNKPALVYLTSCVIITGLFVLLIFTAHANDSIDMTWYKYNNPALYFVNAILGSFVTICFSVILSKINLLSKFLCFYGESSIIIMTMHYRLCRRLLPILVQKLGYTSYLYHPILQISVLIVILIVMIPVIKLINKYLYFLFGKKKQASSALC